MKAAPVRLRPQDLHDPLDLDRVDRYLIHWPAPGADRYVEAELRAFGAERGILTESWSPLAQSRLGDHATVIELAAKYDRDPAHVLLRWNLQLGNIVLNRSRTPERIVSNLDLFSFDLTGTELDALSALDAGSRGGPDPEVFGG